MKIQIEINRKRQEGNIPTSWTGSDAITFGQFLKVEACGEDYVKLFSMFLGIDEAVIRHAKIHGLDSVIMALKFLKTKAPLDIPEDIMGYDIPRDLGLESAGQYMDLQNDIKNTAKLAPMDQLARYTTYVAMYAQKPYDWQQAEALAPKFLDAPAGEVLAIGHFTLMKVIGLSAPMPTACPSLTTRLKKYRLDLKIWVRNTAIMARYYLWRLILARAVEK